MPLPAPRAVARNLNALLGLGLLAAGCAPGTEPEPSPADGPATLVLEGGSVYTVDDERTVHSAIAVRGDQIVAIGTPADMAPWKGDTTRTVELAGRMVLPGLHDLHIHALGTVPPDQCDLASTPVSLEEMVPRLQECITRYDVAPGEWLDVLQWAFSKGNQPSDRYPTLRAALDAVSTEHKIFLWGDDGHHGAANSAALAAVESPSGEVIGVSAATLSGELAELAPLIATGGDGEPTGGVSETARAVVRPGFGSDMIGGGMPPEELMPRVAGVLARSGITSIHDPFVHEDALRSYQWLEASGGMTFRLRAGLTTPGFWGTGDDGDLEALPRHFERLREVRDAAQSELVRADGIKLFADAVLEGNPLTKPPAMPVAAMLDGFRQPLFEVGDDGVRVVGYVTADSPGCMELAAGTPERTPEEFVAEHGYDPVRCEPYAGILEHSEEYIHAYVRAATEAGFHVHIHALADRGVRVAVDALEAVHAQAQEAGLTQSLAHLQVIHPDDVPRIGALGIATVFTFVWVSPDPEYELMVIPFIDEVNGNGDLYDPRHYYMQNVYPARSVLDAGGLVVAGSDAPVGSRDPMPFASLQQALTRRTGEHVLNAGEALDIHEAIAAFTRNGAELMAHADRLGTLEVGKIADLVVLDRNLVELAASGRASEISETRVDLTVFAGDVVFERE